VSEGNCPLVQKKSSCIEMGDRLEIRLHWQALMHSWKSLTETGSFKRLVIDWR
jgi:hypothetical protein